MLDTVMMGLALGISIFLSFGPVTVEAVNRVITKGWLEGYKVVWGCVAVESLYISAAYLGLSAMMPSGTTKSVMFILGGLFLIYLGIKNKISRGKKMTSSLGSFRTGLVVTALSPLEIVFAFIVVGPLAAGKGAIEFLVLLACVELPVLAGHALLEGTVDRTKQFLDGAMLARVGILCSVLLIVLGVRLVYTGVSTLA